jgi:hypothetical protein
MSAVKIIAFFEIEQKLLIYELETVLGANLLNCINGRIFNSFFTELLEFLNLDKHVLLENVTYTLLNFFYSWMVLTHVRT